MAENTIFFGAKGIVLGVQQAWMGLQDNTNDGAKQYEWASKIVKVGTQDSQSGPGRRIFRVNESEFLAFPSVQESVSGHIGWHFTDITPAKAQRHDGRTKRRGRLHSVSGQYADLLWFFRKKTEKLLQIHYISQCFNLNACLLKIFWLTLCQIIITLITIIH